MNQGPLQTVVRSVFKDCLGVVVRWLLLGQYLCISGLFLYEHGWGQHNTQGHKQGACRLQPFRTDNVSQLSDFIKQGLTINPLNTRALLVYFIIFFISQGSLPKLLTVLYRISLSLSYVIPSCALWLSWHPDVTTGLMYKVSCMQCYRRNPDSLMCVYTCTSMHLRGFIFHTKSSFFAHEW